MARWQRRARLGLAVFFVGLAGSLYYVMGERRPVVAVPAVERLGPGAIAETRGGDVYQVKGATRDIRVQFDSQVLYEDGRTRLTGFKATIDNRGGRSFVIAGQEAWIGAELSAYDLQGGVTLETSDGLTATTDAAVFTEADGLLRGEGPIQFHRGRMTGAGTGFTYDRDRDAVRLLSQAVIRLAPDGEASGLEVESGTAAYARLERYLRFDGGVRMLQDAQQIDAGDATVFLQADTDEPATIELRGGSRVAAAGGAGSLRHMQAREITLSYAAGGRTLERAFLSERSTMLLAQPDGSAGQQLAAEVIDLSLAPDGAVTRLLARNQVQVDLPAGPDAPLRTVSASLLNARGEAGRGLTAMSFDGGVEYREAGLERGSQRVVRARTLEASLTPGGTISDAQFAGGVRFEDGALVATSDDARYHVTAGTLTLTSPNDATRPHVQDARLTVDAPAIGVTLSPRRLEAAGGVSSVLRAGPRTARAGGSALLKDSEDVNVAAEKLTYDEARGTGEYTGKAVVWQGDATNIRAERITMDDRSGDLTAVGGVVTTLPLSGGHGPDARPTSLARAGEFRYEDATRQAVYEQQAQFDGPQGVLHAQHIALTLKGSEPGLERLIAEGPAIRLALDERQAFGHKLVYHPDDERYVLDGSPARLVEACREITGRAVTFFRGSERLIVDSNEIVRTETKGGKCPEPPRR